MIPRTPDDILKTIAENIRSEWGNTPLDNPESNRADPLVRILSIASIGLSELELQVEAFIQRENLPQLEGANLEAYGAKRGVYKKTDTKSKAIIMIQGLSGRTFKKGEILKDRYGVEWVNDSDVMLENRGSPCAFGMGVACCSEYGTYEPVYGELVFDNSSTDYIFSATNGFVLEVGGKNENDEDYRRRIEGTSYLSRIKGTDTSGLNEINKLDGVNFSRVASVSMCGKEKTMFVVHGGSDGQICDAIKKNSSLSSAGLVGNVSCVNDCSTVVFQRPCPVILSLNVYLNDTCPLPDRNEIINIILDNAEEIARLSNIVSSKITALHQGINKIDITPISEKPLYSCLDSTHKAEIRIKDPLNNEMIDWGTTEPNGLCGGSIIDGDCVIANDAVTAIKLKEWQYGIVDSQYIRFTTTCDDSREVVCNDC